jgi:hypothetical protein
LDPPPLPPTLKSLIDQNKQAGLEKSAILLAYLLIKLINKQGGIFCLLHEKVERKSEKSKQACSSIKDFRVCNHVSSNQKLEFSDSRFVIQVIT